MLSKNKVKYIQSLRLKKNRQKNNVFLAEGEKIVQELLLDGTIKIKQLIATTSWIETHQTSLKLLNETLIEVTESGLKSVSNLNTPNKVLAVVEMPQLKIEQESVRHGLSLYLDGIQDPGNLGTIMRIADWFGIKHVFCSTASADLYNPKVIQATMGAFLRVQYHRISFEDLTQQFPDVPTYSAVLDGENIFKTSLSPKGILIIGNEGKGISNEIVSKSQYKIRIPAASNHGAESLNAAVATGILCAFFNQQML